MFLSIKINRLALVLLLCVILIIVLVIKIMFSEPVSSKDIGINVPVITYRSIQKSSNDNSNDSVSALTLEEDLIYLKSNGYTPVFISELADYVKSNGKLPDKPVVICFNDGCYTNKEYVMPLLNKYNIKAVMSVVGINADEATTKITPYLSWEDIKEINKSKLVEFANHSYNLHSDNERVGAGQLEGECYEDYRHVFLLDTDKNRICFENNCKIPLDVYVYPYGAVCENSERILNHMGYIASVGTDEKDNYIKKGNDDCLYNLHSYNRSSGISSEKFMKSVLTT